MVRVAKLKARKAKGRVRATWRRVTGAVRYDVAVRRADGRRTLSRTTRPKLVLRGAVRRVSVRALRSDGKAGPAASARVRRK